MYNKLKFNNKTNQFLKGQGIGMKDTLFTGKGTERREKHEMLRLTVTREIEMRAAGRCHLAPLDGF